MSLLDYTPAKLHEVKEWYISFYVRHPQTNKLTIKRIKVNRIKNKKERRQYARSLMNEINKKLVSGWNPFLEQEAAKGFHTFKEAAATYLKQKEKELRPDSIRTYKSYIKTLQTWIKSNLKNNLYVISFSKKNAVDFLNYMYSDNSERVYNNYKRFGVSLFNWFIQNQYCKTNVFKGIAPKKEREKIRVPIDKPTRLKIKSHLEKSGNYEFLAIVYLCFYGLLRPKEITYLKSDHIDLSRQIITIPGAFSKTGTTRTITASKPLENALKKIDAHKCTGDRFIFGKGFKPSKEKCDPRKISKFWDRIRSELSLPKDMQFYSLKDSGIIQMLQDGISPEIVRDQARHTSLETTNKYIKIAKAEAQKDILNKSSEF